MSRLTGIALGVVADAVFGDPRTHHPVAAFGAVASRIERRLYADSALSGACFTAVTIALAASVGLVAERASRRAPLAHTLVTAAATWAALGARSLTEEGRVMAERLESGDIDAARAQLPNLCGRRADDLGSSELARATVESLAENTNDAVVCTLFWGAVAGVPGVLVHRAANTLDAMVGHRNARYARFGTASARLDDALAWVPARLTGALACAMAPLAGGSGGGALRAMCRDHADHPSPNGGWCESAWAGALGVRLGGTNLYGDRVEVRGRLGDPDAPLPDARAVRQASALVGWVTAAATVLAVLAGVPTAVRRKAA